jgi:hypothetical protein
MHAAWPTLVRGARALGLRVIDRCNLTILQRPGYEWVAPFLADHAVDVIASLPCYSSANVEAQRGAGVFSESIAALQRLNALGYAGGPAAVVPGATPIDSPLAPAPAAAAPPVAPPVAARRARLDLVYNPSGAFLPPEQAGLEAAYRAKLAADFGISFDSLFCIANMPIKRFADELRESGQLGKYLELLVQSFNARNVDAVMCRGMVHVAYDGARRGAAARVRWVCKPACLAACLRAPLCCVCFVCAPARLSLAGPLSFSLSLSLLLSLFLSLLPGTSLH